MLQYLINTTAIWLMSLILFDVFLRRESYHNYNRFYLLFTFVLGALLPLIQWQDNSRPYTGTFQKPVEQVIIAKQNIVSAGTPESTTIHWQQWLVIVYLAGVLVAVILLAADMLLLMKYSRKGSKSFCDGWQVIATGKNHAPFSFHNNLYISNRNLYSDVEWSMILVHEKRHTCLFHFVDLLLLQAARILFWFHPLVYIYNKRLLLVHEYQADNAVARQPKVYGSFLIEQAMLQAAPSLSHSFNRSPIKNRIVMLTYKSTAASRTKMLVFLPLAMVCFVCFSKNGFSQRFERNGNKVTYRGNTFTLSDPARDTVEMIDPSTGITTTKVVIKDPTPVMMNGKPVAETPNEQPKYTGGDKDLRKYMLTNMRQELGNLKDGYYKLDISDIIIDENGKIVYFDFQDMKRGKPIEEVNTHTKPSGPTLIKASDPDIHVTINAGPGHPAITPCGDSLKKPVTYSLQRNTDPAYYEDVSKENREAIFNKICQLLDAAPGFIPARADGKNVIAKYPSGIIFWNNFKIKDHKIYDFDNKSMDWKEF